jgi:hypothetical protein
VDSEIKLTRENAAGMTVNERLFVAGLLEAFDQAIDDEDVGSVSEILRRVYLDEKTIEAIIYREIRNK